MGYGNYLMAQQIFVKMSQDALEIFTVISEFDRVVLMVLPM